MNGSPILENTLSSVARVAQRRFPGSTVIGASTAGEFVQTGDRKGSVAAFALSGDFRVHAGLGTGLGSNPDAAIRTALEGLPQTLHGYPCKTAILLLDPLAGNGEEATLLAAELLGPDVRLAGGAAGDDLAMKETWVSCGGVASTDSVVVAMLFKASRVKKP